MNKNLKKIIERNRKYLKASVCRLSDIFDIMFLSENEILAETNDGFRIKKQTYKEIKEKIESAAAGIYKKCGAKHCFIALEMDNSPEWIVAFWAILMSGNKPYLVNLRYPASLSNGIFKTLNIKYILSDKESSLSGETLLISELKGEEAPPKEIFEDEIAFSSSATSMNEVVCFYSGKQISEQILNFEDIIKLEPRIAKHYKGSLRQLAFLPFYHVFGLFAVYFWYTFFGRTLVFLRDYSAETILKTVRRHKVTHIFAVPLLWHTIEKSVMEKAQEKGEKKLKKLQRGLKFTTALQNLFPSLGAAVAKRMMKEVTDRLFGRSIMFLINGGSYIKDSALYLLNGLGYNIYNGYGMSEIGITSVELGRKPKQRNRNSIGRPFSSVEYDIVDGVLLVRGSSLCTKKLVNGEEQIFEGWFNTGDNMECRNGDYFILGRMGDVVIGENGENINPDSIEKLFSVSDIIGLSVLGLKNDNGEELSLVAQINEFISVETLSNIRREVYEINDTLPKASSIKKFYFTNDEICPPNAVKVSRTRLSKQISANEISLVPFSEMSAKAKEDGVSPLAEEVKKIIAEVLSKDPEKISYTDHIFYDLDASSIQYFSILTRLSERFSISDYDKNDKYCYTAKEISEYIEKYI